MPEPPGIVDATEAVAQFAAAYPGLPYLSPAWPTRDHVIPWKLFWLLYQHIGKVT